MAAAGGKRGFPTSGWGGFDFVVELELPRHEQRRPAFGESLQYHAVMRITNVFSQVIMANRARRDTTEAKSEPEPEPMPEANPEPEAEPRLITLIRSLP